MTKILLTSISIFMFVSHATAAEDKPAARQSEARAIAQPVAVTDPIGDIKGLLDDSIGSRYGLENIYRDNSWDNLLRPMADLGDFFDTGQLKLLYIDKGESLDYIILPGKQTVVMMMSQKCPRDKIIHVLSHKTR